MAQIITFINKLFSLALSPFTYLPAWIGLFLISIIAGFILLWIYGKISNQDKIREVKSNIYAHLLESILFKSDVRQCLKAQGSMFLAGTRYFTLALFPVAVLAVPCVFLLAELNVLYGTLGLSANSKAIVELEVTNGNELYNIGLKPSPNFESTPPIRIPETNKVLWRVDVRQTTDTQLTFLDQNQKEIYSTPLQFGNQVKAIFTDWKSSWVDKLLYPSGPTTIPSIASISVRYPERHFSLYFTDTNWLIFFLIFSMASGLIACKIIGVEI